MGESQWIGQTDTEGKPATAVAEEPLQGPTASSGPGVVRGLLSGLRNHADRIKVPSLKVFERMADAVKSAGRRLFPFRRPGSSVSRETPLRDAQTRIETINASMEQEFLSIGMQLQDFHGEARVISDLSSSVANQISGDRITSTIEGLCAILDRVKHLESNSRLGAQTLDEILGILEGIHDAGTRFKGITRILSVLCVTIQIESARFGDSDIGFDTLAGDIKKLGLDIESQFTGILSHSEGLGRTIHQTVSKIIGADAGRTDREKLILDNILLALKSLRERHHLSSEAATRLAGRYREMSANIAEIVTSVQFHDITRQRFEHVGKALGDVIPTVEGLEGARAGRLPFLPGNAETSAGDTLLSPRRVAGICKLQGRQLAHSTDILVEAVESIIENLRSAASNISNISREAQQIAGVCDQSGSCFLTGLETTLSPVAIALTDYVAANSQLSEAMGSVASAVSEMASFVKSIEKIGFEINLIALNAIVKAEHIGEKGAALGILAEAVHDLSLETRTQSTQVSDLFKSIAAAAERIVPEIEGGTDEPGSCAENLSEQLKVHIATTQQVNQDLLDLMSKMEAAGTALARDMESTASRICIHQQVAGTIQGILSTLGELAVHFQNSISTGKDDDDTGEMEELASTYTMESERSIHNSMLDGREPPLEISPATAAPGPSEAKDSAEQGVKNEEDLGDNFELF